jgi:hypothetical protein
MQQAVAANEAIETAARFGGSRSLSFAITRFPRGVLPVAVATGTALSLRNLGDLRKRHEREPVPAHRKQFTTFRAGGTVALIHRRWDAPDERRGRFALQKREVERQVGHEKGMRLLKHDGMPFVAVVFGRVHGRRGSFGGRGGDEDVEDADDGGFKVDRPKDAGLASSEADERAVVHRLEVQRVGRARPCGLGEVLAGSARGDGRNVRKGRRAVRRVGKGLQRLRRGRVVDREVVLCGITTCQL